MRTDLKLNYGALDIVSARIKAYYDAIEDMEKALEGLKGVLENQESEAVEKLLEKIGNTTTNMEGKKTTLKLLKNILDEYTEDMEALVGAVSRNERVRADQYDIWYNITQIESPVKTLNYNASVAAWGNSSWSLPFEDEEGKQKREKEERNYQRLENLRTGKLVSLVKRLQQNISDLWGIYDNYIKPFEKTDDDYRKRLNATYKDRTSGKDKWNNFWDSFGSISDSFLKSFVEAFAVAFAVAFAFTFLLTLSPWLVVGVLAVLAVGCVVMANVPEESVPSWLSGAKKAADAVADEAVKVLEYGPTVLVEDIGQGLMDQVQTPEGIAAVSGGVIGGITGGIAGGVTGKIAGGKVKAKINAKKMEVGEVVEPKPENAVGDIELPDYVKLSEELGKKLESEGYKVIDVEDAIKANADWADMGYDLPPVAENTKVYNVEAGDYAYARVFKEGVNNPKSPFILRADDIKGLNATEIAEKYALPQVPDKIVYPHIPPDTPLEVSIVGPQESWGTIGGDAQYAIKDILLDDDWFTDIHSLD